MSENTAFSMVYNAKCNYCGKELDRNSVRQVKIWCSKECRKLGRKKEGKKKRVGTEVVDWDVGGKG